MSDTSADWVTRECECEACLRRENDALRDFLIAEHCPCNKTGCKICELLFAVGIRAMAHKEDSMSTTPEQIIEAATEAFNRYAADTPPYAKANTPMAKLQCLLNRWQVANFGYVPVEHQALGVNEEVGELEDAMMVYHLARVKRAVGRLAHASLKSAQGIRGMDDKEAYRAAAGDAIADATVYLVQACTGLRLDFETLFSLTAERVMRRNWTDDKRDGGDEPPTRLDVPDRL